MLNSLLGTILRANGLQGFVEISFFEIRDEHRLDDANAEEKEIANEIRKRDLGWITDLEASEVITGHEPQGEIAEPVVAEIDAEESDENESDDEETISENGRSLRGAKYKLLRDEYLDASLLSQINGNGRRNGSN